MRAWWHRALAARRRWRCRRGLHQWGTAIVNDSGKLAWRWVCVAPACGHVQPIMPNYRRDVRVPWR